MERNYGDLRGHVTDLYIDYLERRAEAGVGLVFTEATYVREDGRGRRWQLGAHDDSCVPGLASLARALHAHGSLVGVELNHGGRTAQSAVNGQATVAPSPVPCEVAGGEMPRALSTREVRDVARAFGIAAGRCVRAGIDVLSIHGGHGYLIYQFMSPLYNLRSDEFADPVVFLNLVIEEVRAAAPRLAVGLRFSSVEGTEGGLDADDTLAIIQRAHLESLDFLDVSAGSYEAGELTIQTGEFEPGFLAAFAHPYRSFGLPVGLAGRINTPEVAAHLVAAQHCDFVSIGRALHADPAWASAALTGTNYRPCIACNVCIDGLAAGPVGCTVNPAVGTGTIPLPTPSLRRPEQVTIMGGGPAGMAAARELSAAGALVTLHEQAAQLGGSLTLASRMRVNPEFHRLREWLVSEMDRLRVSVIHASDQVNVESSAESAAVLWAVGGVPRTPDVAGIERGRVRHVRDWLLAGEEPPASCTIWGADTLGVALADTLASAGSEVLLIGQQSDFAPEAGRRTKILAVPRLISNPTVDVQLGVSLLAIGDTTVTLERAGGEIVQIDSQGPLFISQGISGGVPSTLREAIARGTADARALIDRLNSEVR